MKTIKFHIDCAPEPAAGLSGYEENIEVRLEYGLQDEDEGGLTEMLRQTLAEFYDGAKVMTQEEWDKYLVEMEKIWH